jgi:amino acid transporter
MIGSAKFVLTGSAIGLADSVVVIALMMDATNTFTAMIYAELGSSTPEVDDSFLVREGLPRPNAFIIVEWLGLLISLLEVYFV